MDITTRLFIAISNNVEKVKSHIADRRAVTAIEYALIAGLIAVVIIAAVSSLGTSVSKTFNTVSTAI